MILFVALLLPAPPVFAFSQPALVKLETSPVVYYVANNQRYAFPNEKTYYTWYGDFSAVTTISATELASYPLVKNVTYRPNDRLLKITTDPKVYAVSRCGTLHWVSAETLAIQLWGSQWNTLIDDLPDAFFSSYTVGSPYSKVSDYLVDSTVHTIADNATCGTVIAGGTTQGTGGTAPQGSTTGTTPGTTQGGTTGTGVLGGASPGTASTTTQSTTPTTPADSGQGLAAQYPGDINIEKDLNVIFTEMGEEATTQELFTRWDNNSGTNTIALDLSTSPSKSPGHQSIKMSTTAGANPIAILYKSFNPGFDDTVYARWYVKYNTDRMFHHSGIRLGGNNPPSTKNPNSPAGVKPTGSDFFYLGAEPTQDKVAVSTFDFFNMWPAMRGTSFFPGKYYGNSFINDSKVTIKLDDWNCIEVRLKLNNPVTASNGELSMWINGQLVSDMKPGTTGVWNEDDFIPGAGSAFEGFQWRKDPALLMNYFSLSHYVDQDLLGQVNSIHFDHVVLAKKYIGPIQ